MNEEPPDIWFYTCKSERCGPVAFAELKAREEDGSLNPRLDMVWTKGMEEWKPAGEIDGLFKRRPDPEPEETLAPSADPYTSPRQDSVAEHMGREGNWPGARRRSYLFTNLILPFVVSFLVGLAAPLLVAQFGEEIAGWIALGATFVPVLIGVYFGIQRLINVGMSGWWYLGNFVPLLNVWVFYRSFVCPAGYAYHKKLDGPGIFLAIIFWLMLVIGLLAIAAVVAMMFGALGSPELQKELMDALRTASETKP